MANLIGLGQDGYIRYLKEATYGTAPTMTNAILLPVLDGATFGYEKKAIEKKNVHASRIPRANVAGREIAVGSLPMLMAPTLLGDIFSMMLGSATSTGTGSYTHTWLCPVAGQQVGGSFTGEEAQGGSDSVDKVSGNIITGCKIEGNNDGDLILTINTLGQTAVTVARITSFTYPTALDYNFSHADFKFGADLASVASIYVQKWMLEIDLGYNKEEYYSGSAKIRRPQYNTVPTVKGSFSVDATHDYRGLARGFDTKAAKIIITSSETPFATTIELPALQINPDQGKTTIKNDREFVDIAFTALGGITTGSAAVAVPFEIQHIDSTATHVI